MSTMKTQGDVQIEVHSECLDCKVFHRERVPHYLPSQTNRMPVDWKRIF